ncbi:hypothetical protein F2P56_019089 [Juglans regia]|uniref:Protein FAR1-RELATED SEQUENCE n=2 Tax=Juglans regia TaxID=51240 RepID=A0A833XB21_JUGRE|nr:protein FAR-RED ELONGATED HYPOCOTYL 3-like [Juglans regia]KAF5463153.1 hypothetical protein F2P56_019089 [Juglans regia]
MNALFDNLVYSGSTLKEFIDKFDNALRKKVENENAADFNLFKYTIPCISHLYVEKKLQQLYTNSKFKEVQQEIMGMIYCNSHLYKTEGAISMYQVSDQVHDDFIKPVTFSVYFNEDECEAKCICGLFEMRGILCRHILTVFSAKNVQSLPLKYIVDRWRKDLKRRYTFLQNSYDDLSGKPDAHRYSCLLKRCYEVLTIALSSDDHFVDMMRQLDVMDEKYSMAKIVMDEKYSMAKIH